MHYQSLTVLWQVVGAALGALAEAWNPNVGAAAPVLLCLQLVASSNVTSEAAPGRADFLSDVSSIPIPG